MATGRSRFSGSSRHRHGEPALQCEGDEDVMASGRAADREDPGNSRRNAARILDWDPISELHQGQRSDAPHRRAGHMTAPDHIAGTAWKTLACGGRSLIAPPLSIASCFFLLPYRGHGSLRGRKGPPQHLVRSTGAAMSTTGSQMLAAAQGPPSQPPAPSPRRATITSEAMLRMDLGEEPVRQLPSARTSDMARLSARCCA
jgi:hypothetical protein